MGRVNIVAPISIFHWKYKNDTKVPFIYLINERILDKGIGGMRWE